MSGPLLITGGTGFLGREVVHRALEMQIPVRVIGRRSAASLSPAEYYQTDICNRTGLDEPMRGVSCVIHIAGLAHQGPGARAADMNRTNTAGTANIVNAAGESGVKKVVLISSVAVYGRGTTESGDQVSENTPCQPRSDYAQSKLNAELQGSEIAAQFCMTLICLRLATLYGEGGDPGNMQRLIEAIDSNRFVWLGRGNNRKSFIHKSDAARACLVAALDGSTIPETAIFNVCSKPATVAEVVECIAVNLNTRVPRLHLPGYPVLSSLRLAGNALRFPFVRNLRNSVDKWLCDDVYAGAKFESRFRFRSQIDLQTGLARQVSYYEATKERPNGQGRRDLVNDVKGSE